jgi:hypothetical protein
MTRYWTTEGTTSLVRFDGATFAYVDAAGNWIARPELLMKIREPFVDAIDVAEAEFIAEFRGAQL